MAFHLDSPGRASTVSPTSNDYPCLLDGDVATA